MKLLIVIPAHNEERIITQNLRRACETFRELLSAYDWHLLVVENGSSDTTASLVQSLSQEYPKIELLSLKERGKGRAIRAGWTNQEADLFAFMDADLSAELSDLPRLLDVLSDADIAVGSRWHPDAVVERSLMRTVISHGYKTIAQRTLSLPIQDLQCGFKAVRQHVVRDLLPKTTHNGFFFDTELLALAHHEDYRIVEIPITWTETTIPDRHSRVKLGRISWELFRDLWKLRGRLRRLKKKDLV